MPLNRKGKLAFFSSAAAGAFITLLFADADLRKRRRRPRKTKPPKYRRAAITSPLSHRVPTPWRRILQSGGDDEFLLATNFTRSVLFERILPIFSTVRGQVNFGSPYRTKFKTRGRPPQIETIDILGIALWYLTCRTALYDISLTFGLVPSSVSVWLDCGLEVLYRVVTNAQNVDFQIRWPTKEEMEQSNLLLKRNRPSGERLNGVFAVTDGGRMPCADYTNSYIQNAYFEGFTQAVEVTNLFVWDFNGELIHAAVNFPGSWHDNKLAGVSGLYYPELSDEMTPPGFAILGDSAFVNDTRVNKGKVIRARKSNEIWDIPQSAVLAAVDTILQKVMPSERQSAEWGVRAVKGPFSRLKNPLPADSRRRLRMLTIFCHLFNCRTRLVGHNQIRTTYAG